MAESKDCSLPAEDKMTELLVRLARLTELRPRSPLMSSSDSQSSTSSPPSSPSPSAATQDSSPPRKQKTSLFRFCSKLFRRKTQSEGEKESKTKKFPKGTGYSVRKDGGWDVKAFVTDKREKERQVVEVLQGILAELRTQYNNNPLCSDEVSSALEGSVLLPFLESKLERISFLDICNDGPQTYDPLN